MKTILTIFLIASLCFCSACVLFSTDEPEPKTELEKLPPLTTSGENTFGCLVNGEALVVVNTSNQVAIFQQGQLQFGGGVFGKNFDKDITMILGDPLIENQSYFFTDPAINADFRNEINEFVCWYEFQDIFDGHIVFSKIDRTNFIISGTFDFSAVTTRCDTVYITNGRFDMQYIP